MADDARVRYTKMVIRESFIQLNAEKPISQITVKEICEHSGINRSTFYRNYPDVYELKNQLEDEHIEKVREIIRNATIEGTKKTVLLFLQAMKENQSRYISLHDIPSIRLLTSIIDMCFEDSKERILSWAPHLNEETAKWYFDYICTGCAGMMINWARSGMREPPEEIAEFICKMITANSAALNIR